MDYDTQFAHHVSMYVGFQQWHAYSNDNGPMEHIYEFENVTRLRQRNQEEGLTKE